MQQQMKQEALLSVDTLPQDGTIVVISKLVNCTLHFVTVIITHNSACVVMFNEYFYSF